MKNGPFMPPIHMALESSLADTYKTELIEQTISQPMPYFQRLISFATTFSFSLFTGPHWCRLHGDSVCFLLPIAWAQGKQSNSVSWPSLEPTQFLNSTPLGFSPLENAQTL